MASCKDCIHDKVCSEYFSAFWGHTANKHSDLINADTKDCPYFKGRSRFVELPCKVGDCLYALLPKSNAVVEYVVIAFWIEESGVIIRVVDTRFFTTTIFFIKDVGTKVFLTKQKAEQALKERE